jgi:hypothetical protein
MTDTGTKEIKQFVADWYAALDRHAPFEEIEKFLVPGALRFVFPEVTVTSHAELRDWYETVTSKFFDEAHHVHLVSIRPAQADITRVHVVVNWRTRTWTPPQPASQLLEYEADQDWEVETGADGRPRLRTYTVNALAPQGDTPELL